MKHTLFALVFLLTLNTVFSQDQVIKGNYELAARFSPEKMKKMVFSTSVSPHWLKKSDRFWYEYKTSTGNNWYLVDPARKSKSQLFDKDKLAMEITKITKDPVDGQHLELSDLKFLEDENTIRFKIKGTEEVLKKDWAEIKTKDKSKKDSMEKKTFVFHYNISNQQLSEITDAPKDPERTSWANIAPDSSKIVFAKHNNLYWMDKANFLKAVKDEKDSTIVENQITEDGVEDFGYGSSGRGEDNEEMEKNKDKRKRAGVLWNEASNEFVISRSDQRKVKDLWVLHSTRDPRPTLETYKYPMPGDKEQPVEYIYHYSFGTKEIKSLPISSFKDQTISIYSTPAPANARDDDFRASTWLGDEDEFYFGITSRDLKKVDIARWNLSSGTKEVVIEERSNTYIDFARPELVNGGEELIFWSERDGWGHFYLYGKDGTLKRQLTSGTFHTDRVERVDEKARRLFFVANGREKGEDPYYEHLYSVSLDGGAITLLNKGDLNHSSDMNDAGSFFVNNYSRVNTIPVSVLHDRNGAKVMDLETADLTNLFAAGYQFPEPFTFKSDDGITDLYGVMYKPFNFDSTHQYPLIQYVYPGPQTEAVDKAFSARLDRTDRLAQFGFVVITLGNRGGHPGRSKWYHNYGYGDLRDYGLADKKAAIEQLADRHDFIDRSKVGIHGHSGGGFMSTAAMLVYPDIFKVAVSSAGNHENNIYNRWWSEKHHGVKEQISAKGDTTFIYQIEKNPDLAKNLKGHLMLSHGDVDNNVHPANSIRMANMLMKAGKRFDLVLLPGQRHGFGDMTEYFFWRMGDYFVQHLLGDNTPPPVDMIEMQRDKPLSK
ncbi:dipeptidyl aminopeptidase/acylaminoacyl peptidase [Algoriphagus ratkowskyi]|uniref:Dipeptidyl aminopeptidase/acylaminoacyl peptidase n=1 Tax=Algoriphagus ratkowskyi TaxID=57028 RepID=A0A2W7R596_9BACT|nr:DPP IV N-terminal domain-containing protein [Algoriphagus ratkowskyi]PZX53470.1 dipeptidyl aminopeptidase/acylaminoacyl peptidase [Algoriphagus ratkowskyi]TXD76494.1 prolyl oligopeptidase family serine peptidase [Algoriphagus ratkowskyi]